jgi:arylsulfatase A-like enzyme
MKLFKKINVKPVFSTVSALLTCSLVCLLYVFMEWTYNINKSTLANTALFSEKVMILFNSAAILALACLLVQLPFILFYQWIKSEKIRLIIRFLFPIIPSALSTTMLLLIVDNITYTTWKVGIVTSTGFFRGLYMAIWILVFLVLYTRIIVFMNKLDNKVKKQNLRLRTRNLSFALLAILAFVFIPMAVNGKIIGTQRIAIASSIKSKRPNILLITVDSMNASMMSLYGFPKESTPFLEEFAKSSLVGEDHFANAQGTIGSITSILTGRYPADTRVLASSDILEGEDAYEHLPGILKQYGYGTEQLSYSYYADANNLNMQNAFDVANSESSDNNSFSSMLVKALPTNYYYFLREISIRGSERLAHIFFIKDMSNPYKQMTESPDKFNDAYKMETALSLLENSNKPMFIHIHWMNTHGPKYYPENQVFSAGEDPKTQANRDTNFYLDSILEFDTAFSQLYQQLNEAGLLKNTMIVITADHSQRWTITPLPLIMYFPGGSKVGTINTSTENIDIAPTILDYLDIQQPRWMSGQSILSMTDPDRPIFITQIKSSIKDPETGKISYPPSIAPFYQFGKISVEQCDTWFMLNVETMELTSSKVIPNVKRECSKEPLTSAQALELIKQYLETNGFDTSSLDEVKIVK